MAEEEPERCSYLIDLNHCTAQELQMIQKRRGLVEPPERFHECRLLATWFAVMPSDGAKLAVVCRCDNHGYPDLFRNQAIKPECFPISQLAEWQAGERVRVWMTAGPYGRAILQGLAAAGVRMP